MTGIERLRQMAEDFKSVKTAEHCTFIVNTWRGRYIDDAIADIADQIEREQEALVRETEDVSGRDSDALAWVEEHGGLGHVKDICHDFRAVVERLGIEWSESELHNVMDVLDKKYHVRGGFMTTVHAYTNDQTILDLAKGNLRRGRAAAANIVPTTTGAAKAIKVVIPDLDGKLMGGAIRVPVPDGSLVDLSLVLDDEDLTVDGINASLKEASEGYLKGVLGYTTDEIVSSDIIGSTYGSIFDATQTVVFTDKTGLHHVKVVSWYDNENSFTCQYIRLAGEYGKVLGCK